jgi:hypothetical protein
MEPLTSRGEGIFGFWRHNRVNLPIHKAIRFELVVLRKTGIGLR